MATWDIGAVQLEGGATDIGAVQAGAAAAVAGQVILITKAEREAAVKAAIPMLWACQGVNNRRDFMKHTGLAMIGL